MTIDSDERRRDAVDSLRAALMRLWRLGSSALVGWRPTPSGIELITVPTMRLFQMSGKHRRVFAGSRQMGPRTFDAVATALDVQPIALRLRLPVGAASSGLWAELIEQIITPYVVTRTNQRAVFLLDIVDFARWAPEEQSSQLATLRFALNLAAELVAQHVSSMQMMRSTTDDGFYIWNQAKGWEADIALGVTMVLTLTIIATLSRSARLAHAVPVLRTCFGVGSHYTYFEPAPGDGATAEFIVGDVTIKLSRLSTQARPDQILVGAFRYIDPSDERVLAADEFVSAVSQRLNWIRNLNFHGATLERLAIYLSGPMRNDSSFAREEFLVKDKHGFEHRYFNVKLNIFPKDGAPYFCGVSNADLIAD